MTLAIGFDPASGTLVIQGNGAFPCRSLVATVSAVLPGTIQINDIAGRGEQSIAWADVTSLDGSYTPSSMADAVAYLQGEFAKRTAPALEFVQAFPALAWTIRHGLGFRPNVSVVDSAGDLCLADVTWPDASTVVVFFGAPTAGSAYLS